MPQTLLIGLSGPSSSGKTTLARLLRQVFNNTASSNTSSSPSLNLFIIHADDFYLIDSQIPKINVSSLENGNRELLDWDCVESLDLPLLKRVLGHVKAEGTLPDDFASKEDLNSVGESGVNDEDLEGLKTEVERWKNGLGQKDGNDRITICLLDGFLLYPDPESEKGTMLRELYEILQPLLDLKVFIPSTKTQTVDRRTKRTGYVTLEGFWEDPPGYVEDVVWPNYGRDHAWLFGKGGVDEAEVKSRIDDGKVDREVAQRNEVVVGPGSGEVHLRDILPWAVNQVKEVVDRKSKEAGQ